MDVSVSHSSSDPGSQPNGHSNSKSPRTDAGVEDVARQPSSKINPFSRFAYDSPSKASVLGKRKEERRDSGIEGKGNSTRTRNREGIPSSDSKKVKTYDYLQEIDDHLDMGLDIVFCGINPGEQSAQIGHHYGNPNNHFWSCLHESALTTRRLDPREDDKLPRQFSIGLTNLVDRPTVEQRELSRSEQVGGVSNLLEKVARYRPRILCFVGLGIADIVKSNCKLEKARTSKTKAAVGLQPYKMAHPTSNFESNEITETLFFAVSSTSGRVVRYQKTDKIQQFKNLRIVLEKLKNNEIDTAVLTSITQPLSTTENSESH